MTARPPATASGWRPRRGAGRRHPEAVDACGVVLLGSDPPPGRTASLSGRSAPRSCGTAGVSTCCARPPLRYGPSGDTPPAPRLGWQFMGLAARPGRVRPDRPQRPRDPARHRTPNAAPDRNRRLGIGVGDGGFPAGGAKCAVSLCRRRVDVLTEPTGGPFSRGRRGPFFSCHFHINKAACGQLRVRSLAT